MRPFLPALWLLAAAGGQEDFSRRVRSDGTRVHVDGRVLFEGTWKDARVDVETLGGKRSREFFGEAPAWKQVVVVTDGVERLRLPVKSLQAPVPWPPFRLDEIKPVLKRLTETQDGRKTLTVLLGTVAGAEAAIYHGTPQETRVERTQQSFTVFLAGEVLYRVTRGASAPIRVADVLTAVHAHRLRAGLGIPRTSALLSKGCDLHALYLSKNETEGLSGHLEDPKATGYTPEGERAGKRSVISPFAPHETPLDAVESLMATLYHRCALLEPGLTETGAGWAYRRDGLGFLVIDVGSSEGKIDPKVWPVVYPVDGQQDVPSDFALGAREVPNPIPDEGREAGDPVTIQIPARQGRGFDGEAVLLVGGTVVDCWLSTPDRPARADWPQPGIVCLIPKQKLKPGTTYTVRFKDALGGYQKTWNFSTRR
jgi:uncharacterized cupin superfamily protein